MRSGLRLARKSPHLLPGRAFARGVHCAGGRAIDRIPRWPSGWCRLVAGPWQPQPMPIHLAWRPSSVATSPLPKHWPLSGGPMVDGSGSPTSTHRGRSWSPVVSTTCSGLPIMPVITGFGGWCLQVAGAFHSPVMAPAATMLRSAVESTAFVPRRSRYGPMPPLDHTIAASPTHCSPN